MRAGLHILPYTCAEEPLVGFADRLDGTKCAGLVSVIPNQIQYKAKEVDIRWSRQQLNTTNLANQDCFPLNICGIPGWGHYDSVLGLTCHPEAKCRMIQAQESNKVEFIRTKDLRIRGIQGKPVLHRAHIYEFEFQVGKSGDKKRIQLCELQDGMANFKTFLFARNVLWDKE